MNKHLSRKLSDVDSADAYQGTFYPLLDYLRAGAALGVFVSHSDAWHILPENLGNASVQIFFAISGFLIGGILLRSSPKDIPRFYFNRSTRIWIPYFIALALVVIVTVLKQPLSDPKLWEILFYKLTFVYNLFGATQLAESVDRFPLQGTANHFWSICVEEQFYLIAPFVVIFLRRALICLLVGVIALNLLIPNDFSSISVGLILAISIHRFGNWHLQPTARIVLCAVLTCTLFLLFFRPELYNAVIPFVAGTIVATLASTGRQHDIGRVVGGMSFSFYLNTWTVFFALNYAVKLSHIQVSQIEGPAVGLILAFGLSYLHYIFVDQSIIKSRHRWYSKRAGIAACSIGFALFSSGLIIGLSLLVRH